MNAAPQNARSAAPPAPAPAAGIGLQSVRTAVGDALAQFAGKQDRPDRIFMSMALDAVTKLLGPPQSLNLDDPGTPAALHTALTGALTAAYPPNSPPDQIANRDRVAALVNAINGVHSDPPDRAIVTLAQDKFAAEYGDEVAGKMLGGLTVKGDSPPAGVTDIVPLAGNDDVRAFASALGTLDAIDSGRSADDPAPPPLLSALGGLPGHVLNAL